MNVSTLILSGIVSSLLASASLASQVPDLTTFTAGTPAKAAEVNANFSALKEALNDTDSRLSAVENGKQNRITGECQPGMAVSAIGADGSVTCTEVKRTQETLLFAFPSLTSVFHPTGCIYDGGTNSFSGSEQINCLLATQLHLPQGAAIEEVSCKVRDLAPAPYINAFVSRSAFADPSDASVIIWTNASTGNNGDLEVLSGTPLPAADPTIDNEHYIYKLTVYFNPYGTPFDTVGDDLQFWACSLTYTQ